MPACAREDRDCYPAMQLGAVYEIRVVEQWSEDSPLRWQPNVDRLVRPYPRCDGFDGLRAGMSFHIRLTHRQYAPQFGTCAEYEAMPIDGLMDVTFSAASGSVSGPFRASGFTSDRRAYAITTWTEISNPVGARALVGQSPPVALLRHADSCVDLFAAEMYRVYEPSDASVDARAMDAGQGDW